MDVYFYVPEDLLDCTKHYLDPNKKYITCSDFGNVDWSNGGCHWCLEMTPYQCYMCIDESHVRHLMNPSSRIKAKSREEAIAYVRDYKKLNSRGDI